MRRMCWWLLTLAVAKGRNAAKVEISSSAHGAISENAATSIWAMVNRTALDSNVQVSCKAKKKNAIEVENAAGLTTEDFLLKMTNACFFQVDIRFRSNLKRLGSVWLGP